MNDVFAVDALNAWAVDANGRILHTTDGGNTWKPQRSGTKQILWSVFFLDRRTGWVVGGDFGAPGSGIVLKTVDGGASWTRTRANGLPPLASVCFTDAKNGWAVGGANNDPAAGAQSGAILHTTDGGSTWTAQLKDSAKRFFSVDFIDAKTGWVVGDNGTILKTLDGGTTWARQGTDTPEMLRSVYFLDRKHGWTVGYRAVVLNTSDGGATWRRQPIKALSLASVYFVDPTHGWTVGGMGEGDTGVLFATTDGGRTWVRQPVGRSDQLLLNSVRFASGHRQPGWAVGESTTAGGIDSGAILKLTP